MPPKMATDKIAFGMSRVGLRVSSPRVEEASNPANDKKPKTTPRNRAETPVPCCRLKTLQVKLLPFGAECDSSLTKTVTVTARISATVQPSTMSRTLVPPRDGRAATIRASARKPATKTSGAHDGWLGPV